MELFLVETPIGAVERLTLHAATRLSQRGININVVLLALTYGRTIHTHGLTCHVIGYREVLCHSRCGINLSHASGVHVMVASDGAIVTAYRNRRIKKARSIRSSGGRKGRVRGHR